jgi:hypothetical protein
VRRDPKSLQRTWRRSVDKTPRSSATDSQQRPAELAAKPVLARLPDVSGEVEVQRSAKKVAAGGVGYRFDPPQATARQAPTMTARPLPQRPTLKSELQYTPHTSRANQPHMFERNRPAARTTRTTRSASPILPQSNTFAIPRRRLIDSISPFIQFATLVALVAAAGTWVQVVGLRNVPASRTGEAPTTTAQEPANPTTKTAERGAGAPTSTGPKRTTPEANTRVGRKQDDDFARLRGDILPVSPSVDELTPAMPDLIGANGTALPRVQTTELPEAAVVNAPAHSDTMQTPEIARLPTLNTEFPSR